MRKVGVILAAVLLLAGFCAAGPIGGKGGPLDNAGVPGSDLLRAAAASNIKIVRPGDNLQAAYDWLKSDDRDAAMGVLSATNRRCLVLLPGTYTLSATWTIDTDYVDIVGAGTSEDTIVYKASGTTATQTANTVTMQNFQFRTGGTSATDIDFSINADDNSGSVYRDMAFSPDRISDSAETYVLSGSRCLGVSDNRGTFIRCRAGDYAWRQAEGTELAATMYDCTAGIYSYGGDRADVVISGNLYRCIGGESSFGGCDSWGCDITGNLYDCIAGDNSYAMGQVLSGRVIRCRGGNNCFGGYAGTFYGTFYGTFSGYAENCVSTGGNSFGMGHASCALKGTIINCRLGTTGSYVNGQSLAKVTTITTGGTKATATANFTNPNSDLTFTAKYAGLDYNEVKIRFVAAIGKAAAGTVTVNKRIITIYASSAAGNVWATAATVKTNVDAHPEASLLVDVAVEGDGSGSLDNNDYIVQLSGGTEDFLMVGNHPTGAIACVANTTIYPFDSGAVITNAGASGAVVITLPSPVKGLEYILMKVTPDQDFSVSGGLSNTTDETGNDIALVHYKCFADGTWSVVRRVGTWL